MTMLGEASKAEHSAFAPQIAERLAHAYCAIAARCRRDELGARVPALLGELGVWLERHGVTRVGPQLVYVVVDYNTGNLDIEVGLTVESDKRPVSPRIQWRETPAGRYATVVHAGPHVSLVDTTAELLAWAHANRVGLDVEEN
jgi:effector-binding domain-containing protein